MTASALGAMAALFVALAYTGYRNLIRKGEGSHVFCAFESIGLTMLTAFLGAVAGKLILWAAT